MDQATVGMQLAQVTEMIDGPTTVLLVALLLAAVASCIALATMGILGMTRHTTGAGSYTAVAALELLGMLLAPPIAYHSVFAAARQFGAESMALAMLLPFAWPAAWLSLMLCIINGLLIRMVLRARKLAKAPTRSATLPRSGPADMVSRHSP